MHILFFVPNKRAEMQVLLGTRLYLLPPLLQLKFQMVLTIIITVEYLSPKLFDVQNFFVSIPPVASIYVYQKITLN